jgi:hypothetical protein
MSDVNEVKVLVKELIGAMEEVLQESDLVTEKVVKLRNAGYDPWLEIEGTIRLDKIVPGEVTVQIKPLVEGGMVVHGTFTEQDQEELRLFRIKFEE